MKTLFYHTSFQEGNRELEISVTTVVKVNGKVQREKTRTSKKLIEAKDRFTICGLIFPECIRFGISKTSIFDNFSRKTGRSIAYERALHSPSFQLEVEEKNIVPVFHAACKEIEAKIQDGHKLYSKEPEELHLNLQEILEETSPD